MRPKQLAERYRLLTLNLGQAVEEGDRGGMQALFEERERVLGELESCRLDGESVRILQEVLAREEDLTQRMESVRRGTLEQVLRLNSGGKAARTYAKPGDDRRITDSRG